MEGLDPFRLVNEFQVSYSRVEQKEPRGTRGTRGKIGKGFMEERFSISYKQAYPRDARVPRGFDSSEANSRLGFS
jgi:hypothetical protein